MKKRRWILLLLAPAAAGGAALYLTHRSQAGATPVDPSLEHEVRKKELRVEVIDTGKVEPKERVEIKSKVAGQVLEVLVQEGQRVKRGQLLLRLDPTDFEREVARFAADVAQAKNALDFARLSLKRKEAGLAERALPEIEVEEARHQAEARRIGVEAAQIALATAQDRLRYTRLVAPLDATVIELGIKPGEVVTPGVQQTFEGRPLLTLGDLSVLLVRSELNQIDIAKLALGQEAELTFDALPGRRFQARVTRTAPAAVKAKNKDVEVFPVECTLDQADPAVRPGMTADVRFLIDARPNVLLVPLEALVTRDGNSLITRLHKGEDRPRTEEVVVTTGLRNDREVEILSGLSEGEHVLIQPPSAAENEAKL